ncbi:TetR/AcrR family transcriptional regulator [Pseudonocardia humida]|uniref:TetR/AcrR family transcriptional regulator n=1 Tax=Pseudonocardia humida TaxID=2800819 RepID=A0ABT0ZWF3_9PSEU|nr:TetR/AcrR family transcriptional regulator [Pseudonocardia humida]MCO1654989.1 TetR/AcrR family transcriptional regulator [Pseudonocardia humida]
MGNREDLLAGAAQCLRERGWARTTVRDIAAAAGVSHAAIGYHFGSRDALLVAAFVQAMEEWGDEVERAMTAAAADESDDPAVAGWVEMVRSFREQRHLWLASIDAFVQAEHAPELRERLADAQQEGRRGSAAGLVGVPESEVADDVVRSVGSVQMALISGVAMQWLIDPERAPSGADVVSGLRALAAAIGPAPRSGG